MPLHVRRFGASSAPPIVFVAGFGDHGGMFESLDRTALGQRYSLIAVDLPGTGRSAALDRRLTVSAAADAVREVAVRAGAKTIVGHSVGSIVASLVAPQTNSIDTVISIEGNLTLDDAYFSGSAAEYESASTFRVRFLERLGAMAVDNPTLERYRDQIAIADAQSIWELGSDTDAWSRRNHPGEVLARSASRVSYLYNPENTPAASRRWLDESDRATLRLENA
ncbi:MAG: alpha/beta hydrolase, partial [Actinomycetota bacterium]